MPRDSSLKTALVMVISICLGSVWANRGYAETSAVSGTPEVVETKAYYSAEEKAKAVKHYKKGKAYHLEQQYRLALKEYQLALTFNPHLKQARRALIWARRDYKRQKRLRSLREDTLESLVGAAQAHYKRGRKFERENKPLEAAAAYKDALRLIPGYPEAKKALWRVQSQAQRKLAPLPYAATQSSASRPQAHTPLDMSSHRDRREDIKPRVPDNKASEPKAESRKLTEESRQESRLESRTQKTKLVQSKVASSLKMPMPRQRQSSADQRSIRGAIQNHYLTGCKALDQGDYVMAIGEFDLILEFEPQHREAQYKLNVAKKRQSAEIKAVQRTAKKAQSEGDTMGALSAMRDILNIDPNNQEALEIWEKTKLENKGIGDEMYLKGVNAYAKGNYKTALQAWELVLDIDPEHKKARESIAKVREKMELIK